MSSVTPSPTVSIGIPVYNGEDYLRPALESVQQQTYGDWEIVISDNASTDATEQICASLAERDPRVKYFRSSQNRGVAWNFSRVCELSNGMYFKWLAHDDLLDRTFLEKCINVLEQNPDAVLCHTKVAIVDEGGKVIERFENDLKTDYAAPHKRFQSLLNNAKCFELFGIIRMSALKQMPTPVYGSYGHSDGVLLARLSLLGRFLQVPEYLFLNREYEARGGKRYATYREYTVRLDPSKQGKILFPRWRMAYEFACSPILFPLSWHDRVRCMFHLVTWIGWFWKSLGANLVVACVEILGRVAGRKNVKSVLVALKLEKHSETE